MCLLSLVYYVVSMPLLAPSPRLFRAAVVAVASFQTDRGLARPKAHGRIESVSLPSPVHGGPCKMPHSSKIPRAPIKTCPPSRARPARPPFYPAEPARGRGRSRLPRCAVRGGGTSRHSGANSFDTKLIAAAARAAMCLARLDAARAFIAAFELGLRELLAAAFPFYQNGMHNSDVRPRMCGKNPGSAPIDKRGREVVLYVSHSPPPPRAYRQLPR